MDGDAQKYRALAQVLRGRAEDPRLAHDRRDTLAMAERLECCALDLERDQAAPATVPASRVPTPQKASVLTRALSKLHHARDADNTSKNLSFGL
jgi:hypothetical protein